ncbi:MAG TPA: hypothetical protein VK013_09165 [Myxococcaceae bacterium]|nr:hypothetical protein [Myxococcaceae bacterium]
MKKVLIGVGIAFGALVLLGMVGLFAAGMWAKKSLGGMTEGLEEIEANSARAEKLNARFAFDDPGEDRLVALKSDRFQIWLKVGQETQEKYEAWAAELEKEGNTGPQQGVKGVQDAFAKMKLGTRMISELQEATLNSLESAGMSPAEFRAITNTVLKGLSFQMTEQMNASFAESLKQMETSRAEAKAALENPDLSAEERAMREKMVAAMEENVERLKQQMNEAEQDPDRKLLLANAPLIESHKEVIQEVAAGAFSIGLFGAGLQ